MKIILIRHFKVDFRWKFWYSSDEYDQARAGYNEAAVLTDRPAPFEGTKLICSSLNRSGETARLLFGRDPDITTEVLMEVPIKAFADTKVKLPKFVWDSVGRLLWRMNSPLQPETYKQSRDRVHRFISKIVKEGSDVVIVGHGWVMKLMISRLRKLGFTGPAPLYIRNGVPYEYKREP